MKDSKYEKANLKQLNLNSDSDPEKIMFYVKELKLRELKLLPTYYLALIFSTS